MNAELGTEARPVVKAVSKAPRIEGFDVARALAILGMMMVHFMLVMTDKVAAERWSDVLLFLLDGRPAATFVILAGIGVTLMSRKLNASEGSALTSVFVRRGALLLVLGFLNLVIWQGDILRVYGVSLLLVPLLLPRGSKCLLSVATGFVVVFGVLLFTLDYDKNWDWSTMTYHRLWTPTGLVRSLFFDGFRSVFPWTGLLIFGMWLGRLDWSSNKAACRAMAWGFGLVVSTAVLSFCLIRYFDAHPRPGLTHEITVALFGLISMPPLPIFLLNATGTALIVISASVLAARRWQGSLVIRAFSATGRMALTWYVAHIVLGLGGVIALGWRGVSHSRALLTAIEFFGGAVLFSLCWSRRFARGPLEAMFRRVAGG
jgi:uncharacterized protein